MAVAVGDVSEGAFVDVVVGEVEHECEDTVGWGTAVAVVAGGFFDGLGPLKGQNLICATVPHSWAHWIAALFSQMHF